MTTGLVRGGALWSAGAALPGDAVGFENGRIVAIGPESEVRTAIGRPEVEVDAAGGLVHSGFADAHVHAAFAGIEMTRCDLTSAETAEEASALISAYARSTDASWILGGGWAMPLFPGGTPTRAALDALVPDRPAMLLNADHHGAWVNSRALELAGVDALTPDPADGRIEREPDGTPAGVLHEGAVDLVSRYAPVASAEEIADAVATAASVLQGLGITAWQEAIVGDFGEYPDISFGYHAAIGAGRVTGRVSGALWVPRNITLAGIDALVADFEVRRARNATQGFRTTTAKIMIDGVAENRTAAMHDHYCGHDHRGLSYFDNELIHALVVALNTAGFAAHFHAIGDRAVTMALDAVAAVPVVTRRRNHIAHLQVVRPEDRARFAELGMTVNAQALWACNERQMIDLTLPILGAERSRWQYPFGSLARSGAAIAMGSDWPVSTPDPWQAIHVAVTRRAPDAPGMPPLGPAEALTLNNALDAYTRGSQNLIGEVDAGELRVGARADIVIADRNPFAAPADDIHTTRVRAAFCDGRQIA